MVASGRRRDWPSLDPCTRPRSLTSSSSPPRRTPSWELGPTAPHWRCSGAPILLWLAWRGQLRESLHTDNPVGHLWRGLVGVCAMFLGFTALGMLPLPEVVTIGYAAPLVATILAAMFLGERLRVYRGRWPLIADYAKYRSTLSDPPGTYRRRSRGPGAHRRDRRALRSVRRAPTSSYPRGPCDDPRR